MIWIIYGFWASAIIWLWLKWTGAESEKRYLQRQLESAKQDINNCYKQIRELINGSTAALDKVKELERKNLEISRLLHSYTGLVEDIKERINR